MYTDEVLLKLDPELEAIFARYGVPNVRMPSRETIPIARKGFAAATAKYNSSAFARQVLGSSFEKPTWTEKNVSIPTRDGAEILLRIYTPSLLPPNGAPVVVQMHGGGWFMGGLETDALICQIFAAKLRVIVVNVDYRLYPEVAFGVPVLDCYDAVKWIAENATPMGFNLAKGFILSGNSGGGTFAAIATHLARDDNLQPPITGTFATCPIWSDEYGDGTESRDDEWKTLFDHKTEYRSWWQNADAPLMNDKMRLGIRQFAEYDPSSPLLSPFLFPSHKNLPPIYICICGLDPWRDGGVLYKREVENVGGIVKLDVYPGLPHCWWTSYPQLSTTRTWLHNTINGMRWLLDPDGVTNGGSKL